MKRQSSLNFWKSSETVSIFFYITFPTFPNSFFLTPPDHKKLLTCRTSSTCSTISFYLYLLFCPPSRKLVPVRVHPILRLTIPVPDLLDSVHYVAEYALSRWCYPGLLMVCPALYHDSLQINDENRFNFKKNTVVEDRIFPNLRKLLSVFLNFMSTDKNFWVALQAIFVPYF